MTRFRFLIAVSVVTHSTPAWPVHHENLVTCAPRYELLASSDDRPIFALDGSDFIKTLTSQIPTSAASRLENILRLAARKNFGSDSTVVELATSIEGAFDRTLVGLPFQAFKTSNEGLQVFGRVENFQDPSGTSHGIKIIVGRVILDDLPYNANLPGADLRFAKIFFALLKASEKIWRKTHRAPSFALIAEDLSNVRLKEFLNSIGMEASVTNFRWDILSGEQPK